MNFCITEERLAKDMAETYSVVERSPSPTTPTNASSGATFANVIKKTGALSEWYDLQLSNGPSLGQPSTSWASLTTNAPPQAPADLTVPNPFNGTFQVQP
ncbi:unnamed protein product [Dibothriocephalus latus]|uniref:Uncharacterized protein n=1 Tax=Dibothriocephalus latus TaxID=60516 RepID=A0A3P6U0W4_DIBLA|nr:unnamed protein product [Dibothriocephalus latus]